VVGDTSCLSVKDAVSSGEHDEACAHHMGIEVGWLATGDRMTRLMIRQRVVCPIRTGLLR
jgi:hypothetical protein